jgi:hypothetical protein
LRAVAEGTADSTEQVRSRERAVHDAAEECPGECIFIVTA